MKTDHMIKVDELREEVLQILEGPGSTMQGRFVVNRDPCTPACTVSSLIDMTENGEVQIQVDLKFDIDEYDDAYYQVSAHLNSTMQSKPELVLNLLLGTNTDTYISCGAGLTAFTGLVKTLIELSSASAA